MHSYILPADVEMAKAKKAKNEEQRDGENSNSEAVVKHQKLCLSIDMDHRRIYGSFSPFHFIFNLLNL